MTDFQDFKTHPSEKIEANFKKNSFEIKIHDYNKKNYRIAINNLFADIIPEQTSFVQFMASGWKETKCSKILVN